MRKIQNALITVFNKEKIDIIARQLNDLGIHIFSTGGTYDYLQKIGIPATTIESITSYPSIFGGQIGRASCRERV